MTLSVIIPTLNRYEDLTKCIDSILVQTRQPEQLIIVDAGQDGDLGLQMKQKMQELDIKFEYVRSEPGLTRQRNLGVTVNQCDLLLFLDDDVILEKDYIKEMVEIFEADEKGEIGGAAGKMINQPEYGSISNWIRKIFFLPQVSDGKIKLSGANNAVASRVIEKLDVHWLPGYGMCYRNEVFSRWSFNEKMPFMMEDVEFSCRVGTEYKLQFIPGAKLIHNVSPVSRLSLKKRRTQSVCAQYIIFKNHVPQSVKNLLIFSWSMIGTLVQALFLQRSFGAFLGVSKGIALVIFNINTDS